MSRVLRDVRLIPIVLLATISLFALKVSGLVFDGGYTLAERLQNRDSAELKVTTAETVPQYPKIVIADQGAPKPQSRAAAVGPWAQEIFNFNGDGRDITGSVGAKKDEKK